MSSSTFDPMHYLTEELQVKVDVPDGSSINLNFKRTHGLKHKALAESIFKKYKKVIILQFETRKSALELMLQNKIDVKDGRLSVK